MALVVTSASHDQAHALTNFDVDCNEGVPKTSPNIQKTDWQHFCIDNLSNKLIWPPQEMLKNLAKTNPSGAMLSTIIPFGRSPERYFTDFDFPRSIIYWQDTSIGEPVGQVANNGPRVIMGYTPRLNQLEIISYNMNTGENEFRIIHNYNGVAKPKIELKNKNECMTCHRETLPLFSVDPWGETTNAPRTMEGLKNSDSKHKLEPLASFLIKQYPGGPFGFSQLVGLDIALKSNYFQTSKVCSQICRSDDAVSEIDCRKKLVVSALAHATQDENLERFAKNLWSDFRSTKVINFFQMNLEERDLPHLPFNSTERRTNEIGTDPLEFNTLKSNERFTDSPNMSPHLIQEGYSCFRFNKAETLTLKNNSHKLKDFFNSGLLSMIVEKSWLPDEKYLIEKLSQFKNSDDQNSSDYVVTLPLLASGYPVIPKVIWTPDFAKLTDPKVLYGISCLGCHVGESSIGPALPFGEMNKSDFIKLGKYIGANKRAVKSFLRNYVTGVGRVMPPVHSPFYLPTKEQIMLMIEAL
jgi:hypothetical protein